MQTEMRGLDRDSPRLRVIPFSQEFPMRPTCTATLLVDDERVRVQRFDFAPGAETGWHRHGMDYVITAITDCHMQLQDPDGSTRDVLVPAGSAYRRSLGVEHNVINGADTPMSFVEIELK
jgi:quercetin dioxygenase-like cupin family protein